MSSGILLINKPGGITSFDCVRMVKRVLDRRDVGHCGTLDRFATGLLPIAIGEGLKLTRFFLESYPLLPTYWKTYEGVMLFGSKTETGDPEGVVTEKKALPECTEEKLREVALSFTEGTYLQKPPIYSAKKIQGTRASDRVRAGETVELSPVECKINSFVIHDVIRENGGVSQVRFSVRCSKGTYVRTLAEDFAEKLGSVAHLVTLSRLAVGDFTLDRAILLEKYQTKADVLQALLSMAQSTSFLPWIRVKSAEAELLERGQPQAVGLKLANSLCEPNVYCAVRESDGSESSLADAVPVGLFHLKADRSVEYLRGLRTTSELSP